MSHIEPTLQIKGLLSKFFLRNMGVICRSTRPADMSRFALALPQNENSLIHTYEQGIRINEAV